jgi:hypothetical protein
MLTANVGGKGCNTTDCVKIFLHHQAISSQFH